MQISGLSSTSDRRLRMNIVGIGKCRSCTRARKPDRDHHDHPVEDCRSRARRSFLDLPSPRSRRNRERPPGSIESPSWGWDLLVAKGVAPMVADSMGGQRRDRSQGSRAPPLQWLCIEVRAGVEVVRIRRCLSHRQPPPPRTSKALQGAPGAPLSVF